MTYYVGRGIDAISNVEKLDNITFNGGTTYALTKGSVAFTPSASQNILISIDGVVQSGNFSVSTSNIVFDWSPTSSNTCDWIQHYGVGILNVPADGSITASKMGANSVDSDAYVDGSIDAVHLSANSVDSDAYVDGSIDTAHIGNDQIDSQHYVAGSIDLEHMSSESVDEDNLHISNAGSNGQALTKQSGNAGGLTWASVGGGKVLQVISATSNTTYDMYSTTELTTITADITPSATSSKILIMFSVPRTENSDPQQDGGKRGRYFLLRDSTKIFDGGNDSSFSNLIGEDANHETVSGNVIDSPSSTSAITYKVNFNTNTATTNVRWNRSHNNYAGTMTMVLMEIDGS